MHTKSKLIPGNTYAQEMFTFSKPRFYVAPYYITVKFQLNSSNPFSKAQFDFFYGLSAKSLQCFKNAVSNQSYLKPCQFLYSNNQKTLRQSNISKVLIQGSQFVNYPFNSFYMVIDNTKYPQDNNSNHFVNNSLQLIQTFQLQLIQNDKYKVIALALISFIITIYTIFCVINVYMWVKYRKYLKLLNVQETGSSRIQKQQKQEIDLYYTMIDS